MPHSGEPEEPQDVRLVDRAGAEHPVDVIYVGQDSAGTHVWEIIPPWPPIIPCGMTLGLLPPDTVVGVAVLP